MTGKTGLTKTLTGLQLFLVAFGAAVGVGWIIVVGDWLAVAGPLGTALGFLAGAVVLSLVCLCYGELATLFPVAGGEIVYCHEIFGPRTGFLVGWFLALGYLTVITFEAISIGWVAGALFPGIEGPTLAVINGSPLRLGSTVLGVLGTGLLVWINVRGIREAARFQSGMTWARIVVSVGFITAGILGGSGDNLRPLFQATATGAFLPGVAAVLLMTPNWLGGFSFIPQLMEEQAPGSPPRRAVVAMVMQVVLAAAFYTLVTIAVAMVVPWRSIVGTSLPVVEAFRAAFRSELAAKVVLLTGLLGLFTTWNAVLMGASRVLFALGRARMIHPRFGQVHPSFGSPAFALGFTGLVTAAGILLGRRALIPLLTVTAISQAAAFVLVTVGVVVLRRRKPSLTRPYRVPGGVPVALVAAAGAIGILYLAVAEPYRTGDRIPLEWWLLIGWGAIGWVFWAASRRGRAGLGDAERRRLLLGEETPEAG
jgi:amino acid transporter